MLQFEYFVILVGFSLLGIWQGSCIKSCQVSMFFLVFRKSLYGNKELHRENHCFPRYCLPFSWRLYRWACSPSRREQLVQRKDRSQIRLNYTTKISCSRGHRSWENTAQRYLNTCTLWRRITILLLLTCLFWMTLQNMLWLRAPKPTRNYEYQNTPPILLIVLVQMASPRFLL